MACAEGSKCTRIQKKNIIELVLHIAAGWFAQTLSGGLFVAQSRRIPRNRFSIIGTVLHHRVASSRLVDGDFPTAFVDGRAHGHNAALHRMITGQ